MGHMFYNIYMNTGSKSNKSVVILSGTISVSYTHLTGDTGKLIKEILDEPLGYLVTRASVFF